MKIGIQTSRLPGATLNDQFAAAGLLGFDAVEVNIGPAFDLAERIDDVKRAVDAAGVPVCAICTHSIHDPLQPDPTKRQRRFVELERLPELVPILGPSPRAEAQR